MSSAKADLPLMRTAYVPPRSNSTAIVEIEDQLNKDQEKKDSEVVEKRDDSSSAYIPNSLTNKRQELMNGRSLSSITIPESNEVISVDSASESGESAIDAIKLNSPHIQQRNSGIFNKSASINTRNNSRTSSIGNGLNFYSHLEGRKSLFSGSNHGYSYPINNSTLSLTSLNRRQFNASIYGSMSALSDSRLLNTFSPFYKGKTTYGGAAAYNRYAVGANAMRLTPTLIRPTSSLSNFSGSSLTNNVNSQGSENSTISSTAKRILDLINDFATPLSEAKKMASNLKSNPVSQMLPQARTRLNDHDLNESRSMRLSQLPTPYSRPAVILQPSGNASVLGTSCVALPPVKELQVPTMSQLLQMKKLQSTTEKVRKITQNSERSTEYTLPEIECSDKNSKGLEKDNQKHTNKVRNKITRSARASAAAKCLENEEPPATVNLPNIAFPLMQSVPKIDIQLNKASDANKTTSDIQSSKLPTTTELLKTKEMSSSKPASLAFTFSEKNVPTETTVPSPDNKQRQVDSFLPKSTIKYFTFSQPIPIVGDVLALQYVAQNEKDKYQFSPPLDIIDSPALKPIEANKGKSKETLQKAGSCLDTLKKPFILPSKSPESNSAEKVSLSNADFTSSASFGNQFKKSSNEWECTVCLVRNKSDATKCVACETPSKQNTFKSQPAVNSLSQFKKASNEWECDACLVRNKSDANKCVACETPSKPNAAKIQTTVNPSFPIASSFGQQFKKSSDEWECEVCMVRNKETIKCVACETPQKCDAVKCPPIKNTFGDAFIIKSDTWKCPTCLISNKNEIGACLACQTKKPGSTNASQCPLPAPQFKFGFTDATKTKNMADVGFKTIAAQQTLSKWECDACMTRNDCNRTKCACCEQPKPGAGSNAEATSSTSNKFEFGATAASKFKFGFGSGPNGSKEEDIRKEISAKTEEVKKPIKTTFGSPQLANAHGGFQFGFNAATTGSKTDATDYSIKVTDPPHTAVSASSVVSSLSEKPTIAPPPAGLESGPKILATPFSPTSVPTQTKSSTPSVSTASVKFSLPPTSSSTKDDKEKSLPVFGFGKSSALSTTGGFSFGSKIEAIGTSSVEIAKSSSNNTPLKEAATKIPTFAFASSAANTSIVSSASVVSSTLKTTAPETTSTTTTSIKTSAMSVVKPVFSFGMNTSNVSSINSPTSPALSSFVFGSNSANSSAVATTANMLFGSVTSTSIVTSTTNSTTIKTTSALSTGTTASASANIFGSFSGGDTSKASTLPIFGSSFNSPANNNLSSVSSSTNNSTTNMPQFGTFGSKASSNVFGSFGNAGTAKPAVEGQNGTLPATSLFGNAIASQSNQSKITGVVFGTKNENSTTATTTTSASTGPVTSTSTWPKRSFIFGSNASSSTITPAHTNKNENKEVAKTSVFGTFDSSSTNSSSQQQTSIFGVPISNVGPSLTSSVTSATGPTSFSTNLFNTNSAPAATNIFGANSSGNAATPAPAFGSSPFGGSASSTSATPTFGAVPAASGTTFGNFSGSAISTTTNTTEVKKPEAAFNFGAAPAAQSTTVSKNQ